jgi:hypothetical protein
MLTVEAPALSKAGGTIWIGKIKIEAKFATLMQGQLQ